MAHDVFLKIEGVSGPHSEADMEGYIRLSTFSHAIEQPMSGSATGAGAESAGRATHGDFIIVKDVDRTSPRLALLCCLGETIPNVTLEVRESANLRAVYMEYRMSDVIVRSVRPSLSYTNDRRQENVTREQIAFRYGRIRWTYTDNDERGVPREELAHFWDAQQNYGG